MKDAFNLEGYHYSDFNIIKIIDNVNYCWCNSKSTRGYSGWFPIDNIPKDYYKAEINRDRKAGLLTSEMLKNEGKLYKMPAWLPNNYIIEFSPNGGEGEMSPKKYMYNSEYRFEKNEFTKVNYKFICWHLYKIVNGSKFYCYKGDDNSIGYYMLGMEPRGYQKCCFYGGDKVFNLTTDNNCILVAEAQWELTKKEYTLIYLKGYYPYEIIENKIVDMKMPIGKAAPTTKEKFLRKGYYYTHWHILTLIKGEMKYWCKNKNGGKGKWCSYNDVPNNFEIMNFKHGGNLIFNVKEGTKIYFVPVWIKED